MTPPGTIDPTPYLYDSTMYTLAGMMVVSAVAHALVKPIPPKVVVDTTATSIPESDKKQN